MLQNGSMVLSVTFEVLSETVTIDQTYASLDSLINNQALQDTLVDQVKQYTQSMVLTCTVECAEVPKSLNRFEYPSRFRIPSG